MKRGLIWLTVMLLAFGVLPVSVYADSSDAAMAGSGTEKDPYVVKTFDQLNDVRKVLTAHYVLGADIDASETADGGAGWEPIGTTVNGFTGVFDGAGHVIRGLTINRPAEGIVGLFGAIGDGGTVRNVGLVDVSVTGQDGTGALVGYAFPGSTITGSYAEGSVYGAEAVGGLAGRIDGTVSGSYAAGSVSGNNRVGGLVGVNVTGGIDRSYADSAVSAGGGYAGGLVGLNQSAAISLSYATGSIDGSAAAGGLVGVTMNGAIRQSYASGAVEGSGTKGGLVGSNSGAQMVNNYWDKDASGQTAICGSDASGFDFQCEGTDLSTAQALTQASYSGWNFTADWFMVDGSTRPFLRSEWSQTVRNAHQLQLMAMDLTKNYTLAGDVDFGTTFTDDSRSDMWATSSGAGAGFAPIGPDLVNSYAGIFDGKDFSIRNLSINRPGTENVGLFGIIESPGMIRNVGLEAGLVKGGSNTGGLLGFNNTGKIEKAYAAVDVEGNNYVGGLVGNNGNRSTITLSRASGSVTGANNVGGLAGYSLDFIGGEMISQSYATGNVSGVGSVGGLVGLLDTARVTASYATGNVTGGSGGGYVGGLVGFISQGKVNRSYALGQVHGDSSVGGLAGYISGNGAVEQSYAAGDVEGSNYNVGGLVGYMYPGVVRQSYATGSVTGLDFIGGLVGRSDLGSLIEDAYATGPVDGRSEIGGLVGRNVEKVLRSYAVGYVTSTGRAGGLVGATEYGQETASFYDSETTKQAENGKGSPRTTAQMMQSATYTEDDSWDFINVWEIGEGKSYPKLRWSIDEIPPTIAVTMQMEDGNPYSDGDWTNQNVTVSASVYDNKGVTDFVYSRDGGTSWSGYVSDIVLHEDGVHSILFKASDEAGNETVVQRTVKISKSGLTLTPTLVKDDGNPYASGSWTNQSVTVSVYAQAPSGVAVVTYTLDGGAEQLYGNGSTIIISEEGSHMLTFKAEDEAGSSTTVPLDLEVNIDKTAPSITFTPNGNGMAAASAVPTVSVSDELSGLDGTSLQYAWTTDVSPPTSGWLPFANGASLKKEKADGDWYLHVKARDNVGNESIATSNRFRLTTRSESDDSSSSAPVLPSNTYLIDLGGGSVPFEGGELSFPAGAMDRPFRVTIEEITDTSTLPLAEGERLVSRVFEFKKDVPGKFLVKVTVKLRLNADAKRQDGTEFLLCWLDEETGKWVALGDQRVDEDKGMVSGTTDHFTKFAVIAKPEDQDGPAVRFTDLKGHWAEEAILKIAGDGAVSGYPDGTFRPDSPITRAEFASILAAALRWAPATGKVFADTKNHWARDAISTAYANGVIRGYDDDTFAPDELITREQMAVMAANALHLEKPQAVQPFADGDRISKWARESVEAAVENGILSGYPDQTMRPQAHATRAEAVMVVMNILEKR